MFGAHASPERWARPELALPQDLCILKIMAQRKPVPPLERAEPFKPDDLELDRHNPRFGGDDVPAGRKGDPTIIKRLLDDADLVELIESIAANGYLDLEPLFVV